MCRVNACVPQPQLHETHLVIFNPRSRMDTAKQQLNSHHLCAYSHACLDKSYKVSHDQRLQSRSGTSIVKLPLAARDVSSSPLKPSLASLRRPKDQQVLHLL